MNSVPKSPRTSMNFFMHCLTFCAVCDIGLSPCVVAPGVRLFSHAGAVRQVEGFSDWLQKNLYSRKADEVKLRQLATVHLHTMVMEKGECTLHEWLRRETVTEDMVIAVVFLILFTIVVSQRRLPGWRHNDLHTKNVLLLPPGKLPSLALFTVDRHDFYVSFDMLPVIADFGLSTFDGGRRMPYRKGSGGVSDETNFFYDACTFLTSVAETPNMVSRFPKLHAFILQIVPSNCRYGRPMICGKTKQNVPTRFDVRDLELDEESREEYAWYAANVSVVADMLQHGIFSPLRKRPTDHVSQAWNSDS